MVSLDREDVTVANDSNVHIGLPAHLIDKSVGGTIGKARFRSPVCR